MDGLGYAIGLVGVAVGWLLRARLQGWIVRHTLSETTQSAMNRDIEQTVDRWFHRKPKSGVR